MRFVKMILLLIASPMVNAVTDVSDICHGPCSVSDLARLQGEALILKAQENKVGIQKRIEDINNPKSDNSAAGYQQQSMMPMMPNQPQMAVKKEQSDPLVTNIVGTGNRLYGVFRYPDGSEVEGGAGEQLPGGYSVVKVTMDGVTLSKGGKSFRAANAY